MNPAVMAAVARKQRGPVLLKLTAGSDPRAAGVVFTGDGNRTYLDAAGVLRYAPVNRPRYAAYVTDRFGVRRLVWLLEGNRTNYAINGAPMGSSWGGAATKTIAAAAAPDGTMTAVRLDNLTGAAGERVQIIALAGVNFSGRTFCGALWVKGEGADIGKHVTLQLARNAGATGAFGPGVDVALPAAWTRILVPGFTGAADSVGIKFTVANPGGGTAAASMLAWNGQVEEGAFQTSDIVTGAALLTRAAEVAYMPWQYAPQAMSVYESFIEAGTIQSVSSNTAYWNLGHNETPPAFLRYNRNSQLGLAYFGTVNTPGVSIGTQVPVIGDDVEVRTVLTPTYAQLSAVLNGGAETAPSVAPFGANPFPPAWSAPTRLALNGNDGGGLVGFIGISTLVFVTGIRDLSYLRSL